MRLLRKVVQVNGTRWTFVETQTSPHGGYLYADRRYIGPLKRGVWFKSGSEYTFDVEGRTRTIPIGYLPNAWRAVVEERREQAARERVQRVGEGA
jgi:hypothetical protein